MKDSITENYRIWCKKDINKLPIERQFDGMLKDYLYYPEEEWSVYNMRPADRYPLIGSWRNKDGDLFIFLFETNHDENDPDYLVYIAGVPELVKPINGKGSDPFRSFNCMGAGGRVTQVQLPRDAINLYGTTLNNFNRPEG